MHSIKLVLKHLMQFIYIVYFQFYFAMFTLYNILELLIQSISLIQLSAGYRNSMGNSIKFGFKYEI